jgi:uncharacterized integral membrane protein
MDDPNMGYQPPGETCGGLLAKSLIRATYAVAIGTGILLALYHLLALALSASYSTNFGGNVWPDPLGYGVLLALGNLVYLGAITALVRARRWRRHIYKPWIWLPILFTIPALSYINWILVNILTPYNAGSW